MRDKPLAELVRRKGTSYADPAPSLSLGGRARGGAPSEFAEDKATAKQRRGGKSATAPGEGHSSFARKDDDDNWMHKPRKSKAVKSHHAFKSKQRYKRR
jgi:hypothetical protein